MQDVVWQRNGDRWPSPVRHLLEGGDASERTAIAVTQEWFTDWPFTGGRATVRMPS
jgi:hypothetical protein